MGLSIGLGISPTLGQGVGAALPRLALDARWAAVGDSWSARSYENNSAERQSFYAAGVLSPGLEIAGNTIRMAYLGNKAHSGDSIDDIVAQLPSALATLSATGLVFLQGGINSIGTKTAAYIVGQMAAMVATCRAAGHRVFIIGLHNLNPPANEQVRLDTNLGYAGLAARDVKVFLPGDDYNTSTEFVDQYHLNAAGYEKLGLRFAAAIASWMPSGTAFDNSYTSWTANPTLTGGTTAPTSWAAPSTTNAGGATAVGSKVNGKWRVVIAGTVVGTGKYVEMAQNLTTGSFAAAGEMLEELAAYDVIGPATGLMSVDTNGQLTDTGFSTTVGRSEAGFPHPTSGGLSLRAAGSYVARGPVAQVSNAAAAGRKYITTRVFLAAGAVDVTIDFSRIEMRTAA